MELERKLAIVRAAMRGAGLKGVRLRTTAWFAWATCGGSNVVLLTSDSGVAEVLITESLACVLTDEIEAARLRHEELPPGLTIEACRWIDRPGAWDAAVKERTEGGAVASDAPAAGEVLLPKALSRAPLQPEELERYQRLGADAAEAMTEVLQAARPEWTGYRLAGAGAEALWGRGIEPALTLVAGERRLPIYRHATANRDKLGARAMLVFCARRHGLFANLTRFVYFRRPTKEEQTIDGAVAGVEADALDALRPGATLGALYDVLAASYARHGHAGQERAHHQGGTCGYGSRDSIALPRSAVEIRPDEAVAFNPSLPGAKIEDTFVVREGGLQLLTVDRRWPARTVRGRPRPDLLVK
ncbi:MAG: M24 family metallopeptidase [Myxococcales bacterium]